MDPSLMWRNASPIEFVAVDDRVRNEKGRDPVGPLRDALADFLQDGVQSADTT